MGKPRLREINDSLANEGGRVTEITIFRAKEKEDLIGTLMWFQEYAKILVATKAVIRIWRIKC